MKIRDHRGDWPVISPTTSRRGDWPVISPTTSRRGDWPIAPTPNAEARELEERIAENVALILEG